MKTLVAGFALIGALALSGCAKEPKGRIIAVVNGEEITIDELMSEMKDIPAPPGIDPKRLRNAMLQDLIDRKLMAQRAREEGIDKTPAFAVQKERDTDGLLAGILGHNIAQTVPLPEERDVKNYIASHPLQFAQRKRLIFEQLQFEAPKDRRKLDGLRDAHSLDAAAAALQAAGIVFVRNRSAIDTGETNPAMMASLQQVPPGEPILLPQGNTLVVGVIAGSEPMAVPEDSQKIAAARAVRAAALLRESQAQTGAARSKAKIEYEPGFEPQKGD